MGAAVLGVCAMVLGGCVHSTKPVFPTHYDLGPATSVAAGTNPAPASAGKVLRIARITVPSWLTGTAMYYRLGYRGDRKLAAYVQSDWIASPAALLEPIIQRTIAASGDWSAVIGPRVSSTADVDLQLRLDDFSQTFPAPQRSAGIIDATATLVDNDSAHVIAQRHFHIEVAAPTPDAQGGVTALATASRQFAEHLQQWLQRQTAEASRPAQPR